MKIKIKEDRTVIEKPSNKKKVAAGLVAVVVLVAGFMVYRCNTVDTFPKGTTVNGVDVGGMNAEDAKESILSGMNHIKVSVDEGKPVDIDAEYEYSIEDSVATKIRLSAVDPRQLGGNLSYTVPLTISAGTEETAKAIKKAIPIADGVVETKDAHIDLDKMEIVDEIYGNSLDYNRMAEDIAENRMKKPSVTEFNFDSKEYIAVPAILKDDLKAELEFDKEYLADGMKLDVENGGTWDVTPKQLSKVIKYTENGPEYSEEGAKALAKQLKKEFYRDYMTINTQEGSKRIVNYVIEDKVDVDRTAKSIYEACQNGEKGMLCLSKKTTNQLKNRVEVSLTSQTCYYVENGKVLLKTPVVTGSYANYTPPGIFKLAYKQRNVVLRGPNGDGTDYASPVSYWMPFNGGIGLHDASWRGSFGGTIYQYGGSHGCVNMPVDQAGKLYDLIDAGTVVIVYE